MEPVCRRRPVSDSYWNRLFGSGRVVCPDALFELLLFGGVGVLK